MSLLAVNVPWRVIASDAMLFTPQPEEYLFVPLVEIFGLPLYLPCEISYESSDAAKEVAGVVNEINDKGYPFDCVAEYRLFSRFLASRL